MAIARYLARTNPSLGLYPEKDILVLVHYFLQFSSHLFYQAIEEVIDAALQFKHTGNPAALKTVEDKLAQKKSKFVVGNQLTLAGNELWIIVSLSIDQILFSSK